MKNQHEKDLSNKQKAFSYTKRKLSNGLPLATSYLELLIDFGKYETFPKDLISTEFEYGNSSGSSSIVTFVDQISIYLRKDPLNRVIIEYASARKSDRWTKNNEVPHVFCDEYLYTVLSSKDKAELLLSAIRAAMSFQLIVGLFKISDLNFQEFFKSSEIDLNTIKEISSKTEYILLDAFDGEGVLVWSRNTAKVNH